MQLTNRLPPTVSVRATTVLAQRPRNTKTTQFSMRHNSINMGSIEAAIAAIEALEPGDPFTNAKIVADYNVNRITLSRRYKQIQSSRTTQAIKQQKLTPQQEV